MRYANRVTFRQKVDQNSRCVADWPPLFNSRSAALAPTVMLTMMSRDWDVHDWWDRTDRLRQLFHDYRAELLQIGDQISQPLDARTLSELAARVDVIQRRLNVLESIIRRHLARAPTMDAPVHALSQAEMRVH